MSIAANPTPTLPRLTPAWSALQAQVDLLRSQSLRELFAADPQRGERLVLEAGGIYLDYSKQRISDETLRRLLALADEAGLRERIDAMFAGQRINTSESRAVLHVALRAPRGADIRCDGVNVVPQVHQVLDRMAAFADRVRAGAWLGHDGRRMRNVVNIGIGGSDLGPRCWRGSARWGFPPSGGPACWAGRRALACSPQVLPRWSVLRGRCSDWRALGWWKRSAAPMACAQGCCGGDCCWPPCWP